MAAANASSGDLRTWTHHVNIQDVSKARSAIRCKKEPGDKENMKMETVPCTSCTFLSRKWTSFKQIFVKEFILVFLTITLPSRHSILGPKFYDTIYQTTASVSAGHSFSWATVMFWRQSKPKGPVYCVWRKWVTYTRLFPICQTQNSMLRYLDHPPSVSICDPSLTNLEIHWH